MVEDEFDQDHSRAKWTTLFSRLFADLLVEQIRQGNRSNNVFNRKAWKYIRDEFNKQTNLKLNRQQLKNHLDVLRKRYNLVKALLHHDGFSWDVSLCMVIADDEVWQKYIEVHPEAESIRKNGCPIYEQLCFIFSDTGDGEKCALSSPKTAMHLMGQDQSRAKWTMPLEKIFADLMLEQVLRGNRFNNSFSKKAWKHICDKFNRKTGLRFDKHQLKNRHGVLRRLYNNIKSLLGQNGFSWDESRCMVIAESNVWENYMEEHHEVEAVRGRECPVYQQLERIFSESCVEGKKASFDLQTSSTQVDTPPTQDQSKQDQSRAKWTTSLDKIFVDLLIEQTRQKGASSNRTWKRIREKFYKKTGLSFDEQQLRNHQNVLRRLYNNIKSVLDQNGFSWNDSQHMVMADVEVWRSYISEHPEAEIIRTKECPIFKKLCILFSGPGVEGKYVQSSHDIELDQGNITRYTPEAASISAEPMTDEASSGSAEERNISDEQSKRRMVTPLSSDRHKRICTETGHTIASAVLEMACVSNKKAAALARTGNPFSISSCINVLNEMQGVDEDLYLAALDLFQDPNQRETFMSIKTDIRSAWLKAKCNSHL